LPSSESSSHGSDDYVFIKPKATTHPRKTTRAGGYPPRRVSHGEDEGGMKTEEGIKARLEEIVADVRKKKLRDEMAYFVIDFNIKGDHPSSTKLLERLQSKLLAFLNEKKSKALVTSRIETLDQITKSRKEFPKSLANIVFDMHPMRIEEQIDKDILLEEKWTTEFRDVDIYVVPNIDIEKIKNYINQLETFLRKSETEIHGLLVDRFSRSGMLSVKINFPTTSELIKSSSFVYRVHETPRIVAQNLSSKASDQANLPKRGSLELAEDSNSKHNANLLPEICVLDTGVNYVSQLKPLISQRSFEPCISDANDDDDHGTSVAYLAAFGEERSARARIISHKVHSSTVSSNLFRALANAITRYLPKTRIYTCSINYLIDNDASRFETLKIDQLIQASNTCVLFSTGNILPEALDLFNSRNIVYPRYLDHSPIQHPSDAISVVAVGSYCKNSNSLSIAQRDAPSPFTRYSTPNSLLCSCIKPEVVEHGGNLTNNFTCQGVGIKTLSASGSLVERVGTSLSTPIVAGHIAEIEKKYGENIQNSETLKALAYSSCKSTQNHPKFVGFGKPDCEDMIASPFQTAKVVFEGTIRLVIPRVKEWSPAHEITVYVPAKVDKIELYLVHSDNYHTSSFLGLYTYFEVIPEKPARVSAPLPDQGDLRSKQHAKRLVWFYQKAVRGYWTFKLVPHHIGIPGGLRENVLLRYGGVIKMTTTRERSFSLTNEIERHLKRVQ